MDPAVVDKAVFLLRDVHLPPRQVREGLGAYFPELSLRERIHHVQEAYDLLHHGVPVPRPRGSALTRPGGFAAAHELHGFTD